MKATLEQARELFIWNAIKSGNSHGEAELMWDRSNDQLRQGWQTLFTMALVIWNSDQKKQS